ncbi:hypothetical protein ANN_13416 [Periplaneta americana]|uniref:Reverse transcriptase domain-containing protein n=1 Tax=Periplaneta americana TaxID=6978 RepID=A0ABQ8TLF3_PERAM|nr:hypothetical protein ANN_13416 [Periplaneta americana]
MRERRIGIHLDSPKSLAVANNNNYFKMKGFHQSMSRSKSLLRKVVLVVVITEDVQNVHLLLEYRPHIDVSLTCEHDPKLQEYCDWEIDLATHFMIDNKPLNTLLYADDVIILANTEDNLQMAIHRLYQKAKEYNLEISIHKTKTMAFIGKNSTRTKIVINNSGVEQVNAFTYLGCNLSYIHSRDIGNKLAKFQQLLRTIRNTLFKKVRQDTILKFYKTMAIPTLLYGSETWTLTTSQLKRIEAAEMRLLRPLAGYTLYDHKYNEDIRQELNIAAITETIHKYRSNWHEHVLRMPNDRLPRRLLNYRLLGYRDSGRPKKRWRDQLFT